MVSPGIGSILWMGWGMGTPAVSRASLGQQQTERNLKNVGAGVDITQLLAGCGLDEQPSQSHRAAYLSSQAEQEAAGLTWLPLLLARSYF